MNRFSDEQLAIRLLEDRSAGFTYCLFLQRNAIRYLGAFGVLFLGAVVFYVGSGLLDIEILRWLPLFFIGHFFGIVARDAQWVGSLRRQWSFRETTTDWDKVQKLAA